MILECAYFPYENSCLAGIRARFSYFPGYDQIHINGCDKGHNSDLVHVV